MYSQGCLKINADPFHAIWGQSWPFAHITPYPVCQNGQIASVEEISRIANKLYWGPVQISLRLEFESIALDSDKLHFRETIYFFDTSLWNRASTHVPINNTSMLWAVAWWKKPIIFRKFNKEVINRGLHGAFWIVLLYIRRYLPQSMRLFYKDNPKIFVTTKMYRYLHTHTGKRTLIHWFRIVLGNRLLVGSILKCNI